jgi:hypothetical protein
VHKHVTAILAGDKPISLAGIKPFDAPSCHLTYPPPLICEDPCVTPSKPSHPSLPNPKCEQALPPSNSSAAWFMNWDKT